MNISPTMTNTNQDRERTNSRITYAATAEGREKAEQALRRQGIASKLSFAELCGLSRSTITKFFSRKPIELDGFQKICDELELLDWKEIADLKSSNTNGKVEPEPNSCHQTIDDDKKVNFKINVSVDKKNKVKLLNSLIQLTRKLGDDDSIEIIDIEEGSIKLTLKGSPAGLKRLEQLFQSGELSQRLEQELNITVEDVRFTNTQNSDEDLKNKSTATEETQLAFTIAGNVSQADINILKTALIDTSDDEDIQSDQKKSILVKLIKTQGAEELNLIYANLSGANLSGANLSGYNLCRANLSHVNLSYAFLIEAYLFGANLSEANLSKAYLFGANLSEAYLSKAYLFGANLSEAYLIGTNLIGANLSNVIVKKTRFGYNEGMTKSLRDYLIERDAIFEDSPPGDRSKAGTSV